MHFRFALGGAILAAVATLGLASAASAQAVERSGATYHVPVCPHGVGPGSARCHAHIVTDSRGAPLRANPERGKPKPTPNVYYNAAELRDAYNIPYDGSTPAGPIIAIVDAYGYPNAESDLAVYRAQMNLPACTTANGCFKKVNQSGGTNVYPTYSLGWAQETALDLDMVSAMCPTCRILLVEASSNSFSNLITAELTATSYIGPLGDSPVAVSNSWGGGEAGTLGYRQYFINPNGVVTASTGDSGYGVSFPASSDTVIATGGTSLRRNTNVSRQWSETVWSGAGSGCSSVFNRPSYQNPAVSDAVASATCSKRAVGDVSADSDPNTGVLAYGPYSGGTGWLIFGGTSVASPLISGVYGVKVAYGGGPPVSGSVYDAYSTAAGIDPNQLNDVTSGSNGSCGSTALCTGRAGWDGPTGLGTPNGLDAF